MHKKTKTKELWLYLCLNCEIYFKNSLPKYNDILFMCVICTELLFAEIIYH